MAILENILPITITNKAMQMIHQIKDTKKIPDLYGLRIGVKGGGGCGGFTFILGFDHKNEGDAEFETNGLKLYIEKKQMMYVAGKVVDWVETEEGERFSFN
jgi:iron-sulfur cluster assembly protein